MPYDSEASCFTLKIMGRGLVAHPAFQTEPEASNPGKFCCSAICWRQRQRQPGEIYHRGGALGETYFRNFEGKVP